MNINLKLKERRDKINQVLRHKRTKVMRKFKQVQREADENQNNPDDAIKTKIEKYRNVEKMIESFDKKIGGEDKSANQQQMNQRPKQQKFNKQVDTVNSGNTGNKNFPQEKKDQNRFLNKKRNIKDSQPQRKTKEEIEKEKEERLQKRKSIYRKLNRKTPKGQPVMKFQMEHIFKKIKDKINKGMI
jgi:hypothetical protein